MLQDHYLIEQMANFNRERVPERQPHAKGSGAFGHFEVTQDVSKYTKAALFQPGTKTDMLVRFSTVAGERGSPDTWRDPRGFALKFYTSQGNYDVVESVERVELDRPVFDLDIENTHNFIANGIVVHNSGATPGEAVSWGKVDPERLPDAVVCYVDSTVALPLLTAYALASRPPRPPRRLMDRLATLAAQLHEAYAARRRAEGAL